MKIFSPYAVLKKALESVLVLAIFLAMPSLALAENEAVDLFSGFDDQTAPIDTADVDHAPSIFSGYTKLASTFNIGHDPPPPGQTDWRGLSKLRAELLLEANSRFAGWRFFTSIKGFYDLAYELNGRDDYTDQVLDEYEDEVELREAWLQGSLLPALDLKIGRQVVVWGRSDNFRVTDILNPLDNREPGLVDIEDLRLPLTMIKMGVFLKDWHLGLISIHEHRYDKTPVFGHDFYPLTLPPPPETKPDHSLENTELAVDLTGTFSGWDLSLYYASTFNDQPNLVPSLPLSTEHRRLNMLGAAASVARGDLLFISELAYVEGLGFLNDFLNDYERTDLLLGIEYSGFTETVISCDYLFRHLHGYNSLLASSPEAPIGNDEQLALRISRDLLNDTVNLSGLIMVFGDQDQRGALERLTITYDPADNWSITTGAVFYESGDSPNTAYGDNDRLFLEIRYDF